MKIQVLGCNAAKVHTRLPRDFAWRANRSPLAVHPQLQKYIPSRLAQIKSITRAVPFSQRGALRGRHERWERDAMDADALLTNGA
jgi:hypothetical protein